jgi:hypothetical protein
VACAAATPLPLVDLRNRAFWSDIHTPLRAARGAAIELAGELERVPFAPTCRYRSVPIRFTAINE